MIIIFVPSYIEYIIKKLNKESYEAYIVGGAVRDSIMGIEASDYDIATSAKPEEIRSVFEKFKLIDVGESFGTLILLIEGYKVEITTFRTEGQYIDGRKPSLVKYSRELKEDLKRRDFTINSLAYSLEKGYIDYFDGIDDIKNKKIRAVGRAGERFSEDYLRILRAARFASKFDFDIEDESFESMKKNISGIEKISMDRIREEFFKIICSDNPAKGMKILYDIGFFNYKLLPIKDMIGFNQENPHHKLDLYEHSICVMTRVENDIALRLAALFHDIGKLYTKTYDEDGIAHFYGHEKESINVTKKILKELNCSKKLIIEVSQLIRYHMNLDRNMKDKGLKRLLNKLQLEGVKKLFSLQEADIYCSSNSKDDINLINYRKDRIFQILNEKKVYNKRQLNISGRDLLSMGYIEGEKIGHILDYLYDLVLDEKIPNQKELLKKEALNKYSLE